MTPAETNLFEIFTIVWMIIGMAGIVVSALVGYLFLEEGKFVKAILGLVGVIFFVHFTILMGWLAEWASNV